MSAKNFQLVPYALRTLNWTAGGVDNVPLDGLPTTQFGRLCHLAGISFDCTITPTFSTAPTVVGLNNIVSRFEMFDGNGLRFQGSFNLLRAKELLENGRLSTPDPDTNSASTNAFQLRRWWSIGPESYVGNPSDFLFPTAALGNGQLNFNFGALTSISADTTAATVTIRPIAWLALLDSEFRIPPAHEFIQYSAGAADYQIQGRALYTHLALLNSGSYDAIAAGDFASVSVDTGSGQVPTLDVQTLEAAYHAQMKSGQFTQLHGEPRGATDDNPSVKNLGTPTAIVAADALFSPVLWSPWGSRISKLAIAAESSLRVKWTGTQSSAALAVGRIVAQEPSAAAAIAGKALAKMGMRGKRTFIKTLTKDDYSGPRGVFMPMAVKV